MRKHGQVELVFAFAFAAGRFLLKIFQVEPPSPACLPPPANACCVLSATKFFSNLRTENSAAQNNWSARLRTNLGRAAARRHEIIAAHAGQAVVANSSWRDVPMQKTADGWANRTAARRSRLLPGQGLFARRKKLAALAGRLGRGHFRASEFCAHGQHDLLRLHPAVWRDQKSRFHRR